MKSQLTAVGLLSCFLLPVLFSENLRGADASPKALMQQAAKAVRERRLPEAMVAYEQVEANDSRDAAKYKPDALYQLLLLRLGPDPGTRGQQRGAALLDQLQHGYPDHPRSAEIAAFSSVMRDNEIRVAEEKEKGENQLKDVQAQLAAALARADDLAAQLTAAKVTADAGHKPEDLTRLRQDATGLRAENRNLRDQLKKAQTELQQKDEMLKRIAGSVIKRE